MSEEPLGKKSQSRGCLIAVLVLIGLVVVLIVVVVRNGRAEHARWIDERARWQIDHDAKEFDGVKSGGAAVGLFGEPSNLLEMLGDDEDCIRNLQDIYFSSLDLQDPRLAHIKKLTNVHTLSFYDCANLNSLLNSAKGMPSIKEMRFSGMGMNSEMLSQFKSFPNLQKLGFASLHQTQVDWLKRELPNVSIEIDVEDIDTRDPTPWPDLTPRQ